MRRKKEKNYLWEGYDHRGFKETGEMLAKSELEVKVALRERCIKATKIKVGKVSKKKIKPKDISVFTRQLATMTKAGVPILKSLTIVANGFPNKSARGVFYDIKNQIESGKSFAEAFSSHPKQFDNLYVSLVEVGEAGGFLEESLSNLSNYLDKVEKMKKKVRKALTYPAFVLFLSLLITVFILAFIVPTFKEIFEASNVSLPELTLFIMSISDLIVDHWVILLLLLLASPFIILFLYRKVFSFRKLVHKLSLKLPIIGPILTKSIVARWARTYSTMHYVGVDPGESLSMIARVSNNIIYEEATEKIRSEMMSSMPMDVALQRSGVFPEVLIQMAKIGEESGSIDVVFVKVAEIMEEEVDIVIDTLSSLIEPILMLVLGVIVGTIVISIYLPIFQMAGTI